MPKRLNRARRAYLLRCLERPKVRKPGGSPFLDVTGLVDVIKQEFERAWRLRNLNSRLLERLLN